jgi:hypothetical protein
MTPHGRLHANGGLGYSTGQWRSFSYDWQTLQVQGFEGNAKGIYLCTNKYGPHG